jgi:toxin ParE1/3/4
MRYDVLLTEGAEHDLVSIHEYIAEAEGDRAADLADRLSEFPERGNHPRELLTLGIREYRQDMLRPYRIIPHHRPTADHHGDCRRPSRHAERSGQAPAGRLVEDRDPGIGPEQNTRLAGIDEPRLSRSGQPVSNGNPCAVYLDRDRSILQPIQVSGCLNGRMPWLRGVNTTRRRRT